MIEKTYNKACLLYDNELYTESFELFLDLAKQGNIDSIKVVAGMFAHGMGTEKNDKLAFFWYEKLAKIGDEESQYYYGIYLLSENKKEKGIHWLLTSAENNYAEAQYCLGAYYFYGNHVEINKDKAISLYKKAALNGHKQALDDLIWATKDYKGIMQAIFTIVKIMIELFKNHQKKVSDDN